MAFAFGYIRNIDACLAEMASAGTDSVTSYTAWKDMLVWPLMILAVPTIGPGVILSLLSAPMMWRTVCGIAFTILAMLHVLAVVWRWSVFDYEEFIGKKTPKRTGDMS